MDLLFFQKNCLSPWFSFLFKCRFEGAFIIFFSYKARSCIILNLIITIVSQRCIKIYTSSDFVERKNHRDTKKGHFCVKSQYCNEGRLITLISVTVLTFSQLLGVRSFYNLVINLGLWNNMNLPSEMFFIQLVHERFWMFDVSCLRWNTTKTAAIRELIVRLCGLSWTSGKD